MGSNRAGDSPFGLVLRIKPPKGGFLLPADRGRRSRLAGPQDYFYSGPGPQAAGSIKLAHTTSYAIMEVGHLPVSKSMEDKMKNKEISKELQEISNHLCEARNRLDELYQVLFIEREDLNLDDLIKDISIAVEDAEVEIDRIVDEGVDCMERA